MSKQKALIAMSGGVDSSVAAWLVQSMGIDCIGCTMKLYDNEDICMVKQSRTCCSADDIEDAKNVCRRLGIPHYVFNYRDEFEETVMRHFVEAYEIGMTPNPCIECNKYFKFNRLMQRASELGCDYVVSGHYARIEKTDKGYILRKGIDESKDQSYVLYDMNQETLAHTLMPLGTMTKDEIRMIAADLGFVNADKKDSQDICFVPDGDYAAFIEKFRGRKAQPGHFIDKAGNIIGEHGGIIHYTIGQRKGLGRGFGKRVYVCGIDPENNTVVLGDNEDLYTKNLKAENFNWTSPTHPADEFRCKVRTRYNQQEQPASVRPEGINTVHIEFDTPQRAITPGQSAVLYDGDIVIGGGIIRE